jgi:hypothetical protein
MFIWIDPCPFVVVVEVQRAKARTARLAHL